MFQQIGGFIGDLIPFGICMYFTLVLFNVVKLNNKPRFLQNPPSYFKIVALVGLICFAILIGIRIIELM